MTEDELFNSLASTAREALGDRIEKLTYVSSEGGEDVWFNIELKDGNRSEHQIRRAGVDVGLFSLCRLRSIYGVP